MPSSQKGEIESEFGSCYVSPKSVSTQLGQYLSKESLQVLLLYFLSQQEQFKPGLASSRGCYEKFQQESSTSTIIILFQPTGAIQNWFGVVTWLFMKKFQLLINCWFQNRV